MKNIADEQFRNSNDLHKEADSYTADQQAVYQQQGRPVSQPGRGRQYVDGQDTGSTYPSREVDPQDPSYSGRQFGDLSPHCDVTWTRNGWEVDNKQFNHRGNTAGEGEWGQMQYATPVNGGEGINEIPYQAEAQRAETVWVSTARADRGQDS